MAEQARQLRIYPPRASVSFRHPSDETKRKRPAEQAARLAQQEADAVQTETSRVRADAQKMLAEFRADATRDP